MNPICPRVGNNTYLPPAMTGESTSRLAFNNVTLLPAPQDPWGRQLLRIGFYIIEIRFNVHQPAASIYRVTHLYRRSDYESKVSTNLLGSFQNGCWDVSDLAPELQSMAIRAMHHGAAQRPA